MAENRVQHVKITNRNTFVIRDGFDGIAYVFLPGKDVTVPMAVARHIFGFHLEATEQEVFGYVSKRFGWNRPDHQDQARVYFDNISIKPVIFRVVEEPVVEHKYAESDDEETVPDFEQERIDMIPAKHGRGAKKIAVDSG